MLLSVLEHEGRMQGHRAALLYVRLLRIQTYVLSIIFYFDD